MLDSNQIILNTSTIFLLNLPILDAILQNTYTFIKFKTNMLIITAIIDDIFIAVVEIFMLTVDDIVECAILGVVEVEQRFLVLFTVVG